MGFIPEKRKRSIPKDGKKPKRKIEALKASNEKKRS
jgi:hypothetical protein